MRSSEWSSDGCSSDRQVEELAQAALRPDEVGQRVAVENLEEGFHRLVDRRCEDTGAIKAAIRLAGAEALDDAEIGLGHANDIADADCLCGAGQIGRASCRERVCQSV